MRIIIIFFVILLIPITVTQISHADSDQKDMLKQTPQTSRGFFIPEISESNNKIMILLNDAVTQKDIDYLTKKNIKVIKAFHIIPAILIEIPSAAIGGIQQASNAIQEHNKMIDMYADTMGSIALSDSIPQIQGEIPFNVGINGDDIRVCVIDTGVDDTHPDLPTLVAEFDFVNNDAIADDAFQGHGTHVAGIVASNNATDRGVAPNVDLMAAKVISSAGVYFNSNLISAIEWCVDNNADVINMSLGSFALYTGTCDSNLDAIAANNAVNAGVVVMAATGNFGCSLSGCDNAITSPACASNVIAVGAVDKSDGITAYSNESFELDIVAPGTGILSTSVGGSGFVRLTGTSMATPHVAGAAALVLQKFPAYTVQQVKDSLYNNSVDLGVAGYDTTFGNGRLDVSFLNSLCLPPVSGTWTITANCIMTANATAPGNVLVQNNSVLTVSSGITLDIDFSSFNLTVKSGSGVLIKSGGTIT